MRELSSESSFFTLKAVYSSAIKAVSSKALEAVAVAACVEALEAVAAAITAAVTRVTRSCLGLLRPSKLLIVPNLRFSR